MRPDAGKAPRARPLQLIAAVTVQTCARRSRWRKPPARWTCRGAAVAYLARHPDPQDHVHVGTRWPSDLHGAVVCRHVTGVGQDAGRSHKREAAAPHIGVDLERQLEDHCLGEVQHDAAAGDPHLHPVRHEPAAVAAGVTGAAVDASQLPTECNGIAMRGGTMSGLAGGTIAGATAREGDVSFSVEGDYFEVCNCDVSCNCIWLGAATQDNCDVLLAWHVTSGSKDGVDLSGLNAVMAVHSPKRMTDGGWKVALYLDDRASAEQSDALGAVFSGGAGGYLAGLAPLIGEVAGVAPAAITFEKSDGSLHAEVSGALSMSSGQIVGMDGQEAAVITNAPFGAVPQPIRQAISKDVSYHGHWSADFSGTNSFVTDFRYEG